MTDKARELLERAANILELLFEGPNDVDPNTLAMLGDTRLEEIRAYLASEKQDQPEPVAFHKAASEEDMKVYRAIADNYHPAPQRSFVRLSEEKMKRLINENLESLSFYEIARAIEDALEEKNK